MRSMSRSDFALQAHLQAAWDWARREKHDPYLAVERERRSFEINCKFGPTGGRYHQWISRWRRDLWAERGFRATPGMEELDKVRSALKRFDAIKDRLPPEQRDIGQYRTIKDLRPSSPLASRAANVASGRSGSAPNPWEADDFDIMKIGRMGGGPA